MPVSFMQHRNAIGRHFYPIVTNFQKNIILIQNKQNQKQTKSSLLLLGCIILTLGCNFAIKSQVSNDAKTFNTLSSELHSHLAYNANSVTHSNVKCTIRTTCNVLVQCNDKAYNATYTPHAHIATHHKDTLHSTACHLKRTHYTAKHATAPLTHYTEPPQYIHRHSIQSI